MVIAEDVILIETDPNTNNKWRLDIVRVRIHTTKFSLIQREISCHFGSQIFSVIIIDEIGGPSFKDAAISRNCPTIEDFKVRPESSWTGSDSGKTRVIDSL